MVSITGRGHSVLALDLYGYDVGASLGLLNWSRALAHGVAPAGLVMGRRVRQLVMTVAVVHCSEYRWSVLDL